MAARRSRSNASGMSMGAKTGLKAFRRAYPEGLNFVIASDVERAFDRELLRDVHVRYVGIDHVASI